MLIDPHVWAAVAVGGAMLELSLVLRLVELLCPYYVHGIEAVDQVTPLRVLRGYRELGDARITQRCRWIVTLCLALLAWLSIPAWSEAVSLGSRPLARELEASVEAPHAPLQARHPERAGDLESGVLVLPRLHPSPGSTAPRQEPRILVMRMPDPGQRPHPAVPLQRQVEPAPRLLPPSQRSRQRPEDSGLGAPMSRADAIGSP